MRKINDVMIFEGDRSEMLEYLPKGLPVPYFEHLYAPYGLKGIQIRGEWCWTPGTVEDYVHSTAQLRGVTPDQVSLDKDGACDGIGWCAGRCAGTGTMCYATLLFPGGSDPFWVCNCA